MVSIETATAYLGSDRLGQPWGYSYQHHFPRSGPPNSQTLQLLWLPKWNSILYSFRATDRYKNMLPTNSASVGRRAHYYSFVVLGTECYFFIVHIVCALLDIWCNHDWRELSVFRSLDAKKYKSKLMQEKCTFDLISVAVWYRMLIFKPFNFILHHLPNTAEDGVI